MEEFFRLVKAHGLFNEELHDQPMLKRFLRATNLDVSDALTKWGSFLEWRRAWKVESILSEVGEGG